MDEIIKSIIQKNCRFFASECSVIEMKQHFLVCKFTEENQFPTSLSEKKKFPSFQS